MTSAWLPPDQYVQTIERATMYGCLFITDYREWPIHLRAVRSDDEWQFPGGNTELGEHPWQTAQREYTEETGMVFRGEQRLLLSHFISAGQSWPLAKVGFVFDGGRLSGAEITSIRLNPDEHSDVHVAPLEEWRELLKPARYERLEAAWTARRLGRAGYLAQ